MAPELKSIPERISTIVSHPAGQCTRLTAGIIRMKTVCKGMENEKNMGYVIGVHEG